jgi:hypothetical protein
MPATTKELFQAYLAGFNASGQGYNGEYPFRVKGRLPEDDGDFFQEFLNWKKDHTKARRKKARRPKRPAG